MKKYVFIVLIVLFNIKSFSQNLALSNFQISDYIINGIYLSDSIKVNGTSNVDEIRYYISNSSAVIDSILSNDIANNFAVSYNLGSLPVNAVITADQYYQGAYIGPCNNQLSFSNIISKPKWLDFSSATTTVTNISYPNINIHANLDIISALFEAGGSSNDIPGLSGKSIGLSNCNFNFDITHNLQNSQNTLGAPQIALGLDVMGRYSNPFSVPVNPLANLTIDQPTFELAVAVTDSFTFPSFDFNFPKFRFAAGPVPVTIDGGVFLQPQIKGQVIAGYNSVSNSFGFLDNGGTDNTRLVAKLNGSGTLRVTAEAGIASAWGTLTLAGAIGGGLQYTSFPAPTTTSLFGYTLSLYGTIGYRLGPPCFTFLGNQHCLNEESSLTDTFWTNTSSGYAGLRTMHQQFFDKVDAKEIYEKKLQSNPSYAVPDFFAQPSFAQRDTNLVVLWRDYDNNNIVLKLSYLDSATNKFKNEIVIDSLHSSITSPKVALLRGGIALITWTQTRYNSPIDTSQVRLKDLLESQDIYVTLYDPSTNTLATPILLADNTSSNTSGRAEGNSRITLNSDSAGLITWTVGDLQNQLYSIYYATLSDSSGIIQIGNPTLLSDAGTSSDKNVKVAYTDNVNAVAVWIHDEDGLDSTLDQSIVYKRWNGTNWDATQTQLEPTNPLKKIEDLSLDFTDNYGALAYTSTIYDTISETFIKKIEADAWVSGSFTTAPFEDSDSLFYFQNPRITVSNNGIATLIYQANAIYDDTFSSQKSYIYMLVKDLNSSNTWSQINANGLVADTSVYAWDMDASFAGGQNLLVISQEADNITGQAPLFPSNGVRFGANKLNLVIREIAFDANLNVIDASEPSGDIINSIYNVSSSSSASISLHPNPASEKLYIDANGTQIESINIYDALGTIVARYMNPQNNIINISNISQGVYTAEIKTKDGLFNKRWIKL